MRGFSDVEIDGGGVTSWATTPQWVILLKVVLCGDNNWTIVDSEMGEWVERIMDGWMDGWVDGVSKWFDGQMMGKL